MSEWQENRAFEWRLVDDAGRIVGRVERTVVLSEYRATVDGRLLGDYATEHQAKAAVERAAILAQPEPKP